ncbi:MAG: A/G-specific adenine glycosylase [Anaerolineales bacterium]
MPSFPQLAELLLAWYAENTRRLPWRDHPDPYAVWVSEIMLQQTRVETVQPYFQRWMTRFPDIPTLAAAPQQEVLRQWEGLGYYSRARNLHRAAQILCTQHGGNLPASRHDLLELPGIGPYTAAAIASMAFGQDAIALDGNLRRAFARLFDVDTPLGTTQTENRLLSLAQAHLPPGKAGDYNQALMDLGALICTPKKPQCAACPLQTGCRALAGGVVLKRPVRTPKERTPHYNVVAAALYHQGKFLLAQRSEERLLGGLWEFPGGKVNPGEPFAQALQREIQEELDAAITVGAHLGTYRHAFTHLRITLRAYLCTLTTNSPAPRALEHTALAWVSPEECTRYPMGKVDRQIATRISEQGVPLVFD